MAQRQDEERRRFRRLDFEGEARLRREDRAWSCSLLDVSLKGALVRRPEGLPLQGGDRVTLEIFLGDGAVVITAEACTAHVSDTRAGLCFERVDLVSFAHLRRLIELNLGDPDLLHRELDALIESNTPR